MRRFPGAVVRRIGYDDAEKEQTRSPSRSRTRTCLGAQRLGICGSGGRTNVGGVCICLTPMSINGTKRLLSDLLLIGCVPLLELL